MSWKFVPIYIFTSSIFYSLKKCLFTGYLPTYLPTTYLTNIMEENKAGSKVSGVMGWVHIEIRWYNYLAKNVISEKSLKEVLEQGIQPIWGKKI